MSQCGHRLQGDFWQGRTNNTQTKRWQSRLQKAELEHTKNNGAWQMLVSAHSNCPGLITAVSSQFIPSHAKDLNGVFIWRTTMWDPVTRLLSWFKDVRGGRSYSPECLCIGRVAASIVVIESNSNAVRRFIKAACTASDTGPLSVNREHISGAPTHSTGVIMQPTLGTHFGSSHLTTAASGDRLVWKPYRLQ